MPSVEPGVELNIQAVVSKSRAGRLIYGGRPVQVLFLQLTHEMYGIVAFSQEPEAEPRVDPVRDRLFSVVLDPNFKFGCKEKSFTIDFYIYDHEVGDYSIRYTLQIDYAPDWYELVRLLTQAKSMQISRGVRLNALLDEALTDALSPDGDLLPPSPAAVVL